MARRKQSAFDDLVELAALMPWWAGAVLAVISYIVIHQFAIKPVPTATDVGQLGQAMSQQLIRTLATFGQYVIPAGFLFGAVISAVGRAKRKRLLKTTAEATAQNAAKSLSWQAFEMLVGEAFRSEGYAVRETQAGPDGGVDLELTKDGELSLVQCKQWRATKVGVSTVRELFGVMAARGAVAAFVVTTGVFTKEAQRFAEGRNITLIDGQTLDVMIRNSGDKRPTNGPQPAAASSAENKPALRTDAVPNCPKCGGAMVKRLARKGPNAGQEFWGCSDFPQCRGTLPFKK